MALIRVAGQTIPYTSQTKLLGVILDTKLTFQNHSTKRKNIATYNLNRFRRFRLLNLKLQLELFNTLSFSQYAFSPTALLYNNELVLKTGQYCKIKQ